MRRLALSLVLLASLVATAAAQLQSNQVSARPHELNELRSSVEKPEGFDVLSQRWFLLPGSDGVDGAPYNGGEVFVITGKPGAIGRVMWSITWINWEERISKQDDRVYVVRFEGVPVVVKPEPEPDPDDPVPDPGKPARVTYVHDDTPIPREISHALRYLNSKGVVATAIDYDAVDDDGDRPDQYRAALEAAGDLPCLVIESRTAVIKVIASPTHENILDLLP